MGSLFSDKADYKPAAADCQWIEWNMFNGGVAQVIMEWWRNENVRAWRCLKYLDVFRQVFHTECSLTVPRDSFSESKSNLKLDFCAAEPQTAWAATARRCASSPQTLENRSACCRPNHTKPWSHGVLPSKGHPIDGHLRAQTMRYLHQHLDQSN